MLRKKFAKAVAVGAVMGATVLTATAVTALPVSAKQDVERPFKAEGSGTNIFVDPGTGGCDFAADGPDGLGPRLLCDQTIEQTVIGTHIGRSTRTGTGQLHLFVFPGGPVCQGIPFISYIDDDKIVAANGDELHGSSVVAGCSAGAVTQVSGSWTVDGGTGRFENATGGGMSSAVASGVDLSTSWTGTLTY
jgi:hypothetical protein